MQAKAGEQMVSKTEADAVERPVAPGHPIDVTRGAPLREPVGGRADIQDFIAALPVKPTRRRLNIFSMLATGWLPWGVRWDWADGFGCLPWCTNEYIMCCGHTMRRREAQELVDAGLLCAGPADHLDRPTLVITPTGRKWLAHHWR